MSNNDGYAYPLVERAKNTPTETCIPVCDMISRPERIRIMKMPDRLDIDALHIAAILSLAMEISVKI